MRAVLGHIVSKMGRKAIIDSETISDTLAEANISLLRYRLLRWLKNADASDRGATTNLTLPEWVAV
jgi:hypothetical protein